MGYADRARPPRTLTKREQRKLLKTTGETSDTYRDHMLFLWALLTGLREFELVALNVGDVTNSRGAPRARVELSVFKECTDNPAPQTVMVSDRLRKATAKFLSWKKARAEALTAAAPLFVARGARRLSTRRARALFASWREQCELSPRLSFHALRHTFCQRLYEASDGDLLLVQRAARHANITTTTRYAAPSAEALAAAVERLT